MNGFSSPGIPAVTLGALPFSLPDVPAKPIILAVTYGVVIFSIVVQGLTVEKVVRKTVQ